ARLTSPIAALRNSHSYNTVPKNKLLTAIPRRATQLSQGDIGRVAPVRAGSNGSAGQRRNQALRFVAFGMLAVGLVAPVAASNPLQRAPADAAVTVDTVIADVDAGRFAEASSKIERALVGQITAPEHEALE